LQKTRPSTQDRWANPNVFGFAKRAMRNPIAGSPLSCTGCSQSANDEMRRIFGTEGDWGRLLAAFAARAAAA